MPAAADGAHVIATDVNEALVRRIASDRIHTAKLDVLRAVDVTRAALDAGAVGILFNCAGFVHRRWLSCSTCSARCHALPCRLYRRGIVGLVPRLLYLIGRRGTAFG